MSPPGTGPAGHVAQVTSWGTLGKRRDKLDAAQTERRRQEGFHAFDGAGWEGAVCGSCQETRIRCGPDRRTMNLVGLIEPSRGPSSRPRCVSYRQRVGPASWTKPPLLSMIRVGEILVSLRARDAVLWSSTSQVLVLARGLSRRAGWPGPERHDFSG